jgi:polyketide synthase PksN
MMTFEEIWQEKALSNSEPAKIKTLVCFLSKLENQQGIVETIQTLDPQTKVLFISQSPPNQTPSQNVYHISRKDRKTYEQAFQSIRKEYGDVDGVLYLWPIEDTTCIEDYSVIVYMLQSIAAVKLKAKRVLLGAQFENGLERCYLDSWIGFERSLGLVLPHIQVAVMYQESSGQNQESFIKDWMKKLWAELQTKKVQSVFYQKEKRHVYQIQETTLQAGSSLLQAGGTYLITGGCGGLGFLFARHFANTHPVNLLLTGRSILDEEKREKIRELEKLGSRVLYMQADTCDVNSMKAALTQAKEKFGEIHGVIHAAGLAGSQIIFEKDMAGFTSILEPKIKGTLVLDEVLQEEALHFICYFSSSSAILGDFGSCDYAIGNRFQMAYAHYGKEEQGQGEGHGKTIVINWPLWKDGGMGVGEEENSKLYLKSSGQRFLEAEEGVGIFHQLLAQTNTQHLVLVGDRSRVYRFLGLTQDQPSMSSPIPSSHSGQGRRVEMKGLSLEQCIEWDLKEQTSQLLKIPRDKLDREENLADFGFDSISLAQLANLLTNHYGIEVTPALFFGYSTLEKLAQYFLTEHQETLQLFYQEALVESEIPRQEVPVVTLTSKRQVSNQSRFTKKNAPLVLQEQEPIAIIGMSGRFPQARTIDEMWQILADGQDVIQEFSEDRFSGKGKSKYKYGSIPGVSEFDPLFFEISPREAENMDPRQRLLLQESWRALEDAGYGVSQIKTSKIGMFVGVEEGDYRLLLKEKSSITSNHNAILSARLAYFLNLSGPNMAINTACSSGLVAAHQACLSIRNQECDTALAAGVNLLLTPEVFAGMSEAGMLSEDGKCFAFDKRANGMVPAEAVAVVVLKRLSKAKADGDPIYAVIKGSGINYDGKTNGITAPSGVAQTKLLKSVYDQYKINPEEIEYIVTHGTGTKLGDPIEINALYDAFKEYTEKQGYCALTSTKTNFGHALAASGLVSLISLVQAFRHETIPASLHCKEENEYIHWSESPFYVNKESKAWPESGEKKRIGAVSAFGMSGTNVHMVLESYPEDRMGMKKPSPCYLLAFSAKTQESLQDKCKEMIAWLEKGDHESLSEISLTLLEGRQHFPHRCAIVVQDKEDAIYVLKQIGGKEKLPNLFKGAVPRDFTGQKALEEYGEELVKQSWSLQENRNRYKEILYGIADLYCQGYELPWHQLYGETKPSRLHLPTYPFAKESYWVPDNRAQSIGRIGANSGSAVVLHPLLHQNTSDFLEQRFSSIFTGQEFFLKDHVVKGRRVLPGVAYLEMARTAVGQAAGLLLEEKTGMRLKNVVWTRPIGVGEEPVQVHIGLFPEENGEITYEIYSQPDDGTEEAVVHSQGSIVLNSALEVRLLNVKEIQIQCNQDILTSSQCYERFRKMGLEYGIGHQGIDTLYIGEDQVLAKLLLPSSVSDTEDQFVLHPSIMDSALQASIGLMIGSGDLKSALPFALQELEVIQKCTSSMWALIRYSDDRKAGDKVQKLDIDVCDKQGIVCVRMKGFSTRILEGEIGLGAKEKIGMLIFQPSWKEQQAVIERIAPEYIQHVVILCEQSEITREAIKSKLPGVRCITLQTASKSIEEKFMLHTTQVFEEIKSILNEKPKGQVLIQIVISSQKEQRLFSGLSGLLKAAHLENSKLIGQVIEVEDAKELAKKLQKESSMGSIDNQVRYQGGKRWIADWSEIENSQDTVKIPWKNQGIYLITGGAGGLGLIFAQDIAHQVRDTTLIFTGRSVLTAEKQAKLKEIEALGARIEYRQVDVTDKKAVSSLIQSIQKELGSLNGILHCAGVIRDNFILKKTEEELQEVLAPKVSGLVNLDQASKEMQLDFFILFSSIAGSLGNPGQADYAAANAFMDAYAEYRNDLVVLQQRQGQTLSINWPLWKDGGMRVDEETEKMMMHSMGMITMQTSTGIQALYQSVAAGKNQVMIMEGKAVRMKQKLLSATSCILAQPNKISVESAAATGIDPSHLLDKVQAALMHAVSQLLKVKLEDIDVHTELNEYGFDSITFTEFANKLNQDYKIELTPTVFFEYPTIQSFAEYLIEEYPTLFVSKFVVSTDVVAQEQVVEKELEEFQSNKSRRSRFAPKVILSEAKQEEKVPEPIAIVGMTGKFPQAKDLDEFWENLMEGKDCIVEIPKQRWDWQKYYGDPAKEVNKTNIKWGGFIDGVDEFDPLFFGISPREAELMDPQQRLLMTYAWKVIEDAGYSPQDISGTQTGIFVGTGSSGYDRLISKANIAIEGYSSTGIVPSVGPNRMSYLLNIHGPSEPIETACSSSLVAIHRAVNAIENGTCEMAIVGGVNTIVTPDPYISFSKAGMLSEDGRCKTFSDQANGYVRGEGVGMLFLKKLKDAELAGDHIYGVIRGTAENHGGRANSLTAPNPKAQAKLLQTAYTKAGVDPRTVTYIEAHGTGTELGDPIEINGLKAAFKELYEATGDPKVTSSHCGLGSVKTNIGHLELSAGVAGVIKVLLQLKHKTLVKSLHCDRMNPYIQLQDSPFYIVQETKEWKSLQDGEGKDIPCRAGVSSFGFGGVNAHIVIEEYIPKKQERELIPISAQNPGLIVLSAKNEERLKEQVQQLLGAIEGHRFVDSHLADMAYTLQVGREAMEERLAMIVGSIKELEEKLRGFLGEDNNKDLYRGQVKRNKETLSILGIDEDMAAAIDAWVSKRKYAKLLNLWVKGLAFDWNKLYGDAKPQRISLPTYSFAKESYWVPKNEPQCAASATTKITPLLHQNTSNFSEQRFSSTFTGQEFFLKDHAVKGQRIFPEVAYLEMAREAVIQAAGILPEGQRGIRLKNVVWVQPIIVEEKIQVHIGLAPEENGEIAYDIYSQSEETGAVVHSQGSAVLLSNILESKTLDIQILQAECSQSMLSSDQCAQMFGTQGIEKMYVGLEQVLAKLSLPSALSNTQDQFVLHPSVMDSAVQAIGFMMDSGDHQSVRPFTLEEVEITGNCTSTMWALIRHSSESKSEDALLKFNIDLCDKDGVLCVRMRGMGINPSVEKNFRNKEVSRSIDTGALLLASVDHIKKLIAEVTKIPINRLDSDTLFEEVGLDSIMISQINPKIEQWVGDLDPTLFFKYNTIQSLGVYFAESYPELVTQLILKNQKLSQKERALSYTPNPILRSVKTSLRPMRSNVSENHSVNDIAIIGVAGRYPKAVTLEQFWKNLYEGKDCIEEIPPNRWSLNGFFEPDRIKAVAKGLSYSKWGGFLDNVDSFDPLFFNISPRDAMFMDPHERLFLEVSWECLENSGYTRGALKKDGYGNQIGVFVGATFNNYQLFVAEAAQHANQSMYAVNSQIFSIANRVSYLLNFTGPSLTVDTACSSSLYAIHLACESIRNSQSRMAIAGGVNLSLHPSKYITLSKGQFSASDGRCRAFCEGGTGYVPSEAVGAILLKPLQDAIQDDDIIYGVIKGSAASHAGKTNGYTVPNPVSQSMVIENALTQSQIHPRSISCIEAHGTGTALGDPIEVTGLTEVFRKYTKETEFCSISSVKSNIGHAEAAAGIAQITKVLLQLKHQTLVKNVMHGKGLNPNINFAQTPFVVQEKTEQWKRPIIQGQEIPRRAGISSFGAGGANAHVVIEEYISKEQERSKISITLPNPTIIVLSAKNRERLKVQAQQLLAVIEEQQFNDLDLKDIGYTLQIGREAMEERLAIIVESIKELEEKLRDFLAEKNDITDVYCGQVNRRNDNVTVLSEEWPDGIEEWIKCADYRMLADGWVKGKVFDWNKLYGDKKPQRIILPTYPFSKERFWVSEDKTAREDVALSHQSEIQFNDMFYSQLLDNIMDDDISIDAAVRKLKTISK